MKDINKFQDDWFLAKKSQNKRVADTLGFLYAAMQKVVHTDVKISFLAHAEKFKAAFDAGEVLAPAKDLAQMQQIIFNDWVNASLTIIFSAVVIMMLGVMVSIAIKMSKKTSPESFETKPVFAD